MNARFATAVKVVAALALIAQSSAFATAPRKSAATADPATKKHVFVRTNAPDITTLPGFPLAHFRTNISPKLYRSLKISPVTAWVVVQAPTIAGAEPKIIRSDAGGQYDQLALAIAKHWGAVGYNTTESRTHTPTLQVHLLIYRLADAIMAVNFSYNDESFYQGPQHSDVWIGVYKGGAWTQIGGTKWTRDPPRPEG